MLLCYALSPNFASKMENKPKDTIDAPNDENPDTTKKTPDDKRRNEEDDPSRLSPRDKERISKGEANYQEIAREIKKGKERLGEKLTALAQKGSVLDPKDNKEFIKRIETADSGELKEIEEEIDNYENEKSNLKEEETKTRDMEDPEITPYLEEIETLFKDPKTTKYLGEKQVGKFEEWCVKRIKATPSIATAKETLFLVQNHSRDGIKPREEFYTHEIVPFLKKYKLNISQCPYLAEEGFSERKEVLPIMKESAEMLEKGYQVGLYSFKTKQKMITDILKNPNIDEIRAEREKIKQVTRKESEQYVNQSSSIFTTTTVTVHGKSIRAMSEKSVSAFLRDYKDYDLDERTKTLANWKKIVENEGKLVEQLGDIYKDDSPAFFSALKGFELLDYTQKEKALKTHQNLVEKNDQEIQRESLAILNQSLQAIEEARDEKTISDKTAKKYQEAVQNTSAYTNPATGEIDLAKQQKLLDQLTSTTPIYEREKRNLVAYETKRKAFGKDLKKFAKENPEISEEKIKERQEEYDESRFKERTKLHEDLKKEMAEAEKTKKQNKMTEKKLKITEEEKKEAENNSPERTKLIEAVKTYIEEKTPESIEKGLTAVYLYFAFSKAKIHEDKELHALRDELESLQENLGESKEVDKTLKKEMDQEARTTIEDNTDTEDKAKEVAKIKRAETLIEQSEEIHGKETDAMERSEKEALSKAEDQTEKQVIQDFHEMEEGKNEKTALNREGTGENIIYVDFKKGRKMTSQEQEDLKNRLKKEEARSERDGKGSASIQMEEDGETLEKEERKQAIEEKEESLIGKITEGILGKREKKAKTNFSDIATEQAAKRAAERMLEEKEEEERKVA